MNSDELLLTYEREGCDPDLAPAGDQLDFVLGFANAYERQGLIRDGTATPLWRCCDNRDECWRDALDQRPDDSAEAGNITLPWVGREYRSGGVVVVGMNFNDASGLWRAFRLAAYEQREFASGAKKVDYDAPDYAGSLFAYRSTRAAGVVLDGLNGPSVRDRTCPAELVDVLRKIVRLQAVKCSPRNDDRSAPTNEMWARCPSMLIGHDLGVAQPRAIIFFGEDTLNHGVDAIEKQTVGPIDWKRQLSEGYARGVASSDWGWSIAVFGLWHPAYSRWEEAQARLVADLIADPLSS